MAKIPITDYIGGNKPDVRDLGPKKLVTIRSLKTNTTYYIQCNIKPGIKSIINYRIPEEHGLHTNISEELLPYSDAINNYISSVKRKENEDLFDRGFQNTNQIPASVIPGVYPRTANKKTKIHPHILGDLDKDLKNIMDTLRTDDHSKIKSKNCSLFHGIVVAPVNTVAIIAVCQENTKIVSIFE